MTENERKKFLKDDLSKFERLLGYKCDIENPKTFNEKIMRKKWYDRNPLIPLTSDKIKVKEYIVDKLGKEIAEPMFSPRILETYDLQTVLDNLDVNIVIKMNNASGRNIFINKTEDMNEDKVYSKLKDWFKTPYAYERGEWGYQDIIPGAVIERKIFDSEHLTYRFYCFNGEIGFITLFFYEDFKLFRKPVVKYVSTFDNDWNLIPVRYKTHEYTMFEKISQYNIMKKYSEILSKDFDFVRVDWIIDEEKIYFGELTHYPVGGKCKYTPINYDYEWGKLWN